jgi:hypothetical protein
VIVLLGWFGGDKGLTMMTQAHTRLFLPSPPSPRPRRCRPEWPHRSSSLRAAMSGSSRWGLIRHFRCGCGGGSGEEEKEEEGGDDAMITTAMTAMTSP